MTSKEFVIWLKGFTEGVHDFNITPKQWDLLKERLSEVYDEEFIETPGTFQDHTIHSYPPYWSPQSPFHVTSLTGSGTVSTPGFAITTTPNTQGYITVHNPSTHTAYTTGSGAWHYTNTTQNIKQDEGTTNDMP